MVVDEIVIVHFQYAASVFVCCMGEKIWNHFNNRLHMSSGRPLPFYCRCIYPNSIDARAQYGLSARVGMAARAE